MRRNKYTVTHSKQTEHQGFMDFSGLIEPAINSPYINRSLKLEVSTDVGQNYNIALLGAVHSKTGSKKGWVLVK